MRSIGARVTRYSWLYYSGYSDAKEFHRSAVSLRLGRAICFVVPEVQTLLSQSKVILVYVRC